MLGAYAALFFFAGGAAPDDKTIATLPHNLWYAIGMSSNASLSALPNGLALVTLVSNFGTFMLYMLTCYVAIVAFREHHMFNGFKHMFVPLFGLSVTAATIMAVPLCAVVLFGVGAYKALTLVGDWRISGLQMTVIGMVSAAAGYGIGRLLHVSGA